MFYQFFLDFQFSLLKLYFRYLKNRVPYNTLKFQKEILFCHLGNFGEHFKVFLPDENDQDAGCKYNSSYSEGHGSDSPVAI